MQNRCLLETGCLLTITKKVVDTGFQVIPKRWIVVREPLLGSPILDV
ncbi:hypothetical protein NOX90_03440 [Wolbachia endosymbiont of Anurida maritima]